MIRCLSLFLCICASAVGQSMVNYIFTLEGGATVLYQVYNEVPIWNDDKTSSKAEHTGNRIRRLLVDKSGVPWLGFEVHIRQLPGEARFALSVEPIAGVPFFAHKPTSRTLENADRVLFDVLEQPSTGKRVFDTFQVGTKGTPMQIMPLSRAVPQPAAPGDLIRLENPRLLEGTETLASASSSQTGVRVGIEASETGQFLFSSEPAPGYRMEAIAEENSLRFVVGAKQYTVRCTHPVMSRPGAWYLWVKAVPAPQSAGSELRVFVP
jgi:hypothetical protein